MNEENVQQPILETQQSQQPIEDEELKKVLDVEVLDI